MAAKTCAACGKKAEGRFCSWCGASLAGTHCSSCGSAVEPGARFCNACGAPVGAGGSGASGGAASGGAGVRGRGGPSAGASGESPEGSRLVWGVAGVFLVGLILAIAIPAVRQQEQSSGPAAPAQAGSGPAGAPSGAAPGGGAASVDLASMTPRERAEALYERIMRTTSAGDSAGAAFFLPMALQAYEMARPLDADGHFHLSLLQRMAGDSEAGLATAREALAAQPNHLLNLASAAGAAAELGDTATAREHYQKYLDVYDQERARGLPEYEGHSAMFIELNEEAESFLGSR